ncbi:MAG: TlpA disulfide reductase family protein [Alphaproteobacteria bacterium]|nr:TlpA disulfide reductase family protein [Alphaproteobacteria bacterium]
MLQRRTILIAGLAAATPAYATPVPLPPSLDDLSSLPLQTFANEATTLGRNLRPGPSVISFWASWCAPCVEEAMHLSTIRHRYDAVRLNIIGLNVELVANEDGVRRFLDQTRPTYTQLRADVATYQAFGGEAQLNLPRLFIFDATGRPTAAFGAFDAPTVNRAISNVVS